MIKLIDILNEIEDQPLTYKQFIEKIHRELVPYKGGHEPKGKYYNEVIAAIEGKTNKKDIIDALKELEKISKYRPLSSLIGKCMNDFKVEEPRWNSEKMKTVKRK